jgi:hypothetical protein
MQDPAAPRDVIPVTGSPPGPAVAPLGAAFSRWADAQPATAPYDFDEFERLARARGDGRRRSQARVAALAASVSLVLVGAALWQRAPVDGAPPPAATAAVTDAAAAPPTVRTGGPADAVASAPAVVRVHDAALRADLQDRIAVLDALLSEARAAGEDDEPLRQVQRSRNLLADSLQHVAWADGLSGR